MNKDKKLFLLFNKRWDKKKHQWHFIGRDVLKYKVEYECINCGQFHQLDVYNMDDVDGHKQLLNHLIPKCR